MWFGHAVMRIEGTRLIMETPSPFAAQWIDAHFALDLKTVAMETFGINATVLVMATSSKPEMNVGATCERSPSLTISAPAGSEGDAVPSSQASGPGRRQRPGSRRAFTFRRLDTFVVGLSNRLAYAAACRLADEFDPECASPLFIHGECGVGKTHLLQGLCARFIEAHGRPALVKYVTGEQFTNEYIAAVRANTLEPFRQRIRRLDLLAIDDVHFLSNKTRTQKELLHTLDAIALNGARVAFVSDNHPQQLESFDKGLISRLLSGLVVKVDRPDRDMRLELIRRLAAQRGLRLTPTALEATADRCIGSVRELEGGLTRLAAFHELLGKDEPEIGLALAEQAFKDGAARPTRTVRLATVLQVVCQRMSVTKSEIMGSGRHQRVVLARSLVVYLARELTTHSFPEIAQMLGRVNHSTVHTADQRLRQQLVTNKPCILADESPVSLRELAEQLRRDAVRPENAV